MRNLFRMTATVDEMRRLFGPFEGATLNLPLIGDLHPVTPRLCSGEARKADCGWTYCFGDFPVRQRPRDGL